MQAFYVDGKAFCVLGDSAVARRAIQFGNAGGLPQFPNQGVLAPTASDYQNFHIAETNKVRWGQRMMSNGCRGFSTVFMARLLH